MKTTFILVRHGETFENVNNITQGQFNSQLSEKGIYQAKQLADRLKEEKIDIAFSSDLDRAHYTCKEILKFHPNIKLKLTNILREQNKGIYEQKKYEKPKLTDNISDYVWKPEGGESLIEVYERIIPFFEKIKKENEGKIILIVTHGGPIRCLMTYLHKDSLENHKIYQHKNTAISIVDFVDNKTVFRTINCVNHLK